MQRDPLGSHGLKLGHELPLLNDLYMHSIRWSPLVEEIDSCSEEHPVACTTLQINRDIQCTPARAL